jgi:hypothetical protein
MDGFSGIVDFMLAGEVVMMNVRLIDGISIRDRLVVAGNGIWLTVLKMLVHPMMMRVLVLLLGKDYYNGVMC